MTEHGNLEIALRQVPRGRSGDLEVLSDGRDVQRVEVGGCIPAQQHAAVTPPPEQRHLALAVAGRRDRLQVRDALNPTRTQFVVDVERLDRRRPPEDLDRHPGRQRERVLVPRHHPEATRCQAGGDQARVGS